MLTENVVGGHGRASPDSGGQKLPAGQGVRLYVVVGQKYPLGQGRKVIVRKAPLLDIRV